MDPLIDTCLDASHGSSDVTYDGYNTPPPKVQNSVALAGAWSPRRLSIHVDIRAMASESNPTILLLSRLPCSTMMVAACS
jgi:hypothetical protein